MKALLLTSGIFFILCGGEFVHVGTSIARAISLKTMPDWLPFVLIAIGSGLVIETAFRTEAK